MRKYSTDYRLWALISGSGFVFVASAFVIRDGFHSNPIDGVALGIGCAAVGWVFHAIAVIFGVRLSTRVESEEANDYDDDFESGGIPAKESKNDGHV